jgi:hypothetical protein
MKNSNIQLMLILLLTSLMNAALLCSSSGPASVPIAPGAPQKSSRNFELKWNVVAGLSALAGTALWAHSQHNHSKIGHNRYPLMQQRNIIRARMTGLIDPTERARLQDELAEINYRIERLHARKSRLNLLRILGALTAISGLGATAYGIRKKTPETK